MNKVLIDQLIFPGGILLVYLLMFLVLYPETLLIADERAYVEQAYALSQGSTYDETALVDYGIIPKHYPLGTALAGALFIWLIGSKGIFLLGAVSLLIAVATTARLLKRLQYPPFWSLLILLFPPAILLSRQVMSELPSLAILSLFFLSVFCLDQRRGQIALATGFLAGLSLAFRETNLLLVIPFLLGLLWRKQVHIPLLLAGGLIGLLVRLISAGLVYGSWFYVKDPGAGFGFQFLPANALIFGIALCLFIPLGLPALFRYRGVLRWELLLSLGLFILFHLFYGYNGWRASGFYAFILGPRFFIPALPLFVVAVADWGREGRGGVFSRKKKGIGLPLIPPPEGDRSTEAPNQPFPFFKTTIIMLAFLSIVILQGASHYLGQSHQQIVKQLYRQEAERNYLFINSPVIKYISSLYGDLGYEDVSQLQEEALPDEDFYLHFLERNDTPNRRNNTHYQKQQLDFLWNQVNIHEVDTMDTVDGSRLLSFRMKKRNISR